MIPIKQFKFLVLVAHALATIPNDFEADLVLNSYHEFLFFFFRLDVLLLVCEHWCVLLLVVSVQATAHMWLQRIFSGVGSPVHLYVGSQELPRVFRLVCHLLNILFSLSVS